MADGSENVDPAALIGAVLVFGAVLLLDRGLWTWADTFVTLVVAGVVYAYLFAPGRWHVALFRERWAIVGAMVVLLSLALAFPAQEVWEAFDGDECEGRKPDLVAECEDNVADRAFLVAGAVVVPVAGVAGLLRLRSCGSGGSSADDG